jgi:hypothetical protein
MRKEQNLEVTGAATPSCLKRRWWHIFFATHSPSHRHAGTRVINIQSKLDTTPDFCKNVSLAVLFGSNSNSFTISTQSDMCVYSFTFFTKLRRAGRAKEIKYYGSSECRVPRKSFRLPFLAPVP